ncbi:MAG TPA: glyoxalase superfamily protein [Bryobacteraceae bacterium]|jgi:catechol 2,3-dioxygenase-like lactoylglutathione lyase family enzyme|nr:glyoxalase superfamily protein [Bryobacteraceae bacterium]
MTKFRKVMPVLRVDDLSRAIDWYSRLPGFELCWRSPNDGDGENCMLRADDIAVTLSTGSYLGGTPAFTGTLYFEMEGVQEFHDLIKDRVEILWPLEKMPFGGLEFSVRDPDGYTLAFAEAETGA